MKARILVELDALLDTRLGTLLKMGPYSIAELIDKGYRARKSDRLSKINAVIDDDTFKRMYAERDVDTLKLSKCTNYVVILKELLEVIERKAIYTPEFDSVEVALNIWPYKLSVAEQEAMMYSVRYMIAHNAEVKIVNYSPADLTPELIDGNFEGMVIYNYNDWHVAQAENLMKMKIPTVTIFCPAILYNKDPLPEELKVEGGNQTVDPFAELEYIMAAYINLIITDVKYFSLVEI
jgi:hypothetical protein